MKVRGNDTAMLRGCRTVFIWLALATFLYHASLAVLKWCLT